MTRHRWAWVEVDLDAIRANVLAFRQLTGPGVKFMAVVKADAYGHGAVAVARAAVDAGAEWLGVATADEALELRAGGLAAPVLVLAEPPEEALSELIAAQVTCTATSLEFLRTLSGFAMLERVVVPWHLKIDTGMNRIGVAPTEAATLLTEAATLPGLRLGGVFTHFATADVDGDWDVRTQIDAFETALRHIRDAGLDPGIVHSCNSAGAVLLPQARYDMVRVGISLYGLHPSDATRDKILLTPAMSVHARATRVKAVSMGEGVGYGLTYRVFKPVQLVTLPLGYADGIPRLGSNKLDVMVAGNGRRVEQAGNVCMDQLMCAVPPREAIEYGDEFVLAGRAGSVRDVAAAARGVRTSGSPRTDGFISIDEIAETARTINHEICCGLGQRLERVYVNG
ncbi:MAG: alanine racemase [Actinomycetes bacterium]|jgi:alanine racemase|nr:alanine racemase [Actinomycetes bacterium]